MRTKLLVPLLVVMLVLSGMSGTVLAEPHSVPTDTTTQDETTTTTPTETDEENNTTDTNESEPMPPGMKLSGVIASQGAQITGQLEQTAFNISFTSANSEDAKVQTVASKSKEVRNQINEIKQEKATLKQEYKNGNISRAEYVTRMSTLSAQIENTKDMAASVETKAQSLPAGKLEQNGVNATAILQLKEDASNLSGAEVSEIARSIAGEKRPDHAGPDKGKDNNQTEKNETNTPSAEEAIDTSEQVIDKAKAKLETAKTSGNTTQSQIQQAESLIQSATDKVESAKQAENSETSIRLANEAIEDASEAIKVLNETNKGSGGSGTGNDKSKGAGNR